MIKRLAFILLLIGLGGPAMANDYIQPSWPDLLRTMIRFKALDINDNQLIDQYAEVAECELYTAYYSDDFKWNQVRGAIRDSARMNVAHYPIAYGYETPLELDRYDFDQKAYLFTADTAVKNINAFLLYEYHNPPCKNLDPLDLPKTYRAILDTPLTVAGMPITQKDGEAMLQRMRAEGNMTRRVYARFNMTVTYIEPWRPRADVDNAPGIAHYSQSSHTDPRSVRMNVRLDSIDFYEDAAMTRLLYETKI